MTAEQFKEKERVRHREYYARNREKSMAYYRNRRTLHRAEVLQKEANYRNQHRDHLNKYGRELYHAKGELNREKKRSRYKENKSAMRSYQVAYIKAHYERMRPKALQRYKRFRTNHPEKAGIDRAIRRARKMAARIDSHATAFIRFVRSRQSIPCYYCGKVTSGKKAHIDHIQALSKSGNHTSDNLCASCPRCNLSKHSRSLAEWMPSNQPLLNF